MMRVWRFAYRAAVCTACLTLSTGHAQGIEFLDLPVSTLPEERLRAVSAFMLSQDSHGFEETVNVALVALNDTEDSIALRGAYIVQRLARRNAFVNVKESGTSREKDLILALNAAIDAGLQEGSDVLAPQLAVAYRLYRSDSPEFERQLLRRLTNTSDLHAQREFVDTLAWDGLKSVEARQQLREIVLKDTTIVARESAIVLSATEVPDRALIGALVRLAAVDDFFCDPRLLSPLLKNKAVAREFLSQLRALHSRLQEELAVDEFKRKTKIYAPQVVRATLDRVIAEIETSA